MVTMNQKIMILIITLRKFHYKFKNENNEFGGYTILKIKKFV